MSNPPNPLRAAMDARDPAMINASLAPDAVIHSPIFSEPLVGRELATEVFSIVYEVFGEMTILLDIPGDPHLFEWRSYIGGQPVEGIDMFRLDAAGQVCEVRIFMRPMSGVAAFLRAAGKALATRRGTGRALALRGSAFPLVPLMKATDRLGPRLIGKPPAA